MRKRAGFALGVVLTLIPVICLMAWTFLEFGTLHRANALQEEFEVRGLQAAEAGIRFYLAKGRDADFELNGCRVRTSLVGNNLVSSAYDGRRGRVFEVALETEKGFVVGRRTNEE